VSIPARQWALLEERSQRARTQPGAGPSELNDWSDSVRRVPNVALRSALFAAINKGPRPYLERAEIQSQKGNTIVYTGALLDQSDLDVWQTVVFIACVRNKGAECRVTAYQLLKTLGRTDSGKNRQILDKQLSRLKATALQLRSGDYSYEGSLIQELYREHCADRTRSYVIRLNTKMQTLFSLDQFTQIDWSVRQALRGKPLAQWLHGFYASHAAPFPLKISTLHRLCGSRAKSLTDFKKDLRRSLDSLSKAGDEHGQPFSYSIVDDLIRVKTTPTPSQRRHLADRR